MPRKKKEKIEEVVTPVEEKKIPWFSVIPYIERYPEAEIYQFFGGRSNGKSYSTFKFLLQKYRDHGEHFAYLRRWGDDIKQFQCETLIKQELVDEVFGPDYEVKYRNHKFTLVHHTTDENGKDIDTKDDIAWALSISESHHYKGSNFVNCPWIFFDEFIEMGNHDLPNEYNRYEQVISTIKRTNKCKIIMCANPISKFSPYFVRNGINSDLLEQGVVKESLHQNGKAKVICLWTPYIKEIAELAGELTSSKLIGDGYWEIPDVSDVPQNDNERVEEKLLCTAYNPEVNATIGIFVRYGVWTSYETSPLGLVIPEEHEREFLVIRRLEEGRKSSYFHLTNQKSLSSNYYSKLEAWLADIKDQTDIDIKNELQHLRVFAADLMVGDLFSQIWNYYAVVKINTLL